MKTTLIALAFFVLSACPAFSQGNWSQFLGTFGNGTVSEETSDLPITWSETENVVWKTPIPGRGYSSPVIWRDQVWLSTADSDDKERYAICVNKTSGEIEHKVLLSGNDDVGTIVGSKPCASPTPCIEEGRVYLHFGTMGTYSLDTTSGAILWSRTDIHCLHTVGPGSSPILYGNLLILVLDGTDTRYLIALDKTTGETVWTTDRSYDFSQVGPEYRKAFGTPVIASHNGRDYLISSASKATYAYDPKTGDEIWRYDYPSGYSSVAKPILVKDRVIVNSGGESPSLYCLSIDGSPASTEQRYFWTVDRRITLIPTFAIVEGYLYNASSEGIGLCFNAETGENCWTQRLGGNFWASAIATGDRVYFFAKSGESIVIAADSKECRILARNMLDAGLWATPAVADQALFVRTLSHLYRIQNTKAE